MHFSVACLNVLTTRVTQCVCHAELKGYLLTYLLTYFVTFFVHLIVIYDHRTFSMGNTFPKFIALHTNDVR